MDTYVHPTHRGHRPGDGEGAVRKALACLLTALVLWAQAAIGPTAGLAQIPDPGTP